jgi:multisubunit Na+/H+ antiporter MnhC subunit
LALLTFGISVFIAFDRRLRRLALLLAAISFAVIFIFMTEHLVRDWRLGALTAAALA